MYSTFICMPSSAGKAMSGEGTTDVISFALFYTADKSIRRGIAQCQVKRTLGPRWSWQRAQPWEILVGSENM